MAPKWYLDLKISRNVNQVNKSPSAGGFAKIPAFWEHDTHLPNQEGSPWLARICNDTLAGDDIPFPIRKTVRCSELSDFLSTMHYHSRLTTFVPNSPREGRQLWRLPQFNMSLRFWSPWFGQAIKDSSSGNAWQAGCAMKGTCQAVARRILVVWDY